MSGIPDPRILAGQALAAGLAIPCILYGLLNRNRGTGEWDGPDTAAPGWVCRDGSCLKDENER